MGVVMATGHPERQERAHELARRIVRGVFRVPGAFALGFGPEYGEEIDVAETSVWHRLTQLGYLPDEISAAHDEAMASMFEPGAEQIPWERSPRWGHA